MNEVHDIPGNHRFMVSLPDMLAATATGKVGAWAAPFKCKIVSIEYVGGAAVTGDNTNSKNLNVQLADGTEIAALDFVTAANLVAGVKKAFTLSGSATQLALADGAGLLIECEKTGTGVLVPAGQIVFTVRGN